LKEMIEVSSNHHLQNEFMCKLWHSMWKFDTIATQYCNKSKLTHKVKRKYFK
jgi:hypothetical protein